MNSKKITAVLITFNSAKTIQKSLASLKYFDNIIVYDSFSTDNTVAIANSFINVTVVQDNFYGFGETKNKAVSFAKTDWILSLDSDEMIPEALSQEISKLDLNNSNIVYKIKRDNIVLGRKMKHSGLANDWLVRIFNKNNHQFSNKLVHEKIELTTNSQIIKLQNSFLHFAVLDSNDFLLKIAKYSKLSADEKTTKKYSLLIIMLKTIFAFVKTYFLQLGFLDGWRGLLVAVSNANGRFYRYIRLINY